MIAFALLILAMDFSVEDGGLTSTGDTLQWEWAPVQTGPAAGAVGWSTRPAGNYLHDSSDQLEVSLGDPSTLTRPVLRVEHAYDIRNGDVGVLQASTGAEWVDVSPVFGYPVTEGFVGTSPSTVTSWFNLSAHAAPDVRVRFAFSADAGFAGAGWFIGAVSLYEGDPVPPQVTPVTEPVDTQDLVGPYAVVVEVVDDQQVDSVNLVWSHGGGTQTVSMTDDGFGTWSAGIDAALPNDVVSWHVNASDGFNVSRWPDATEASFRVFLAAPTDLFADHEGRKVTQELLLTWEPPVGPHAVESYRVYEAGEIDAISESDTESALVPLTVGPTAVFEVSAIFAPGEGDRSEALAVEVEVPRLLSVSPPTAFHGDRVYVELSGEHLYLVSDQTTLSLDDLSVESVWVLDAQRLRAQIVVPVDAPAGSRDVVVTGGQGTFTFSNAFEIVGEDPPKLVSITPNKLVQGEQESMLVLANANFDGDVEVRVDEDLLVVPPITVNGATARFALAAKATAAAGPHTVVLDDGDRLWTIEVDVDEFRVSPRANCSVVPADSSGGLGWLMGCLAFGLLRRGRRVSADR